MPGYVPRMAIAIAGVDACAQVELTARPTPTPIPSAIPSHTPTPFAAHHQWGNLWNAILTFSKVSFIAYMRHLCARASVSAAVAATRDAAR